jgi:transketolase
MTYENLLKATAEQDPNLMVLTAENRAVIRGLPPVLGGRFIDFGIAEQTMIGAAAGLALRGRTPVAHALATFLIFRAYEFVRDDVCIPGLPVKLVGGVPGFLSDGNGPTHQAIEDVALMRGLPNMQVFTPSDEVELLQGMPKVLASGKPCYIRYCGVPAVVEHQPFELGKAEVLSEGKDVTLLTYGFMLRETVAAKKVLESKGVSVRLVNLRMPKPADEQAIVEAVKATGDGGDHRRSLPHRRPVVDPGRGLPKARRGPQAGDAHRAGGALVQAGAAQRRAPTRRFYGGADRPEDSARGTIV